MKSTFSKDEIKNEKMKNFSERINFIKYWADYIRKNSDNNWSEGQAKLIDSQIDSSRRFYKKLAKMEEGRKKIKKLKGFGKKVK